MPLPASAVSHVLSIETPYQPREGSAARALPQRIAVFAQGQTGYSYPSEKWTVTNLAAVVNRYGPRSPINAIVRQLKPVDGSGVGAIPVTIYPLPADPGSGAAAAVGSITPSGTATMATSHRARIGGVLTEPFTIAAGAVTGAGLTAACRAIRDAIDKHPYINAFATYTYGVVTATYDRIGSSDGTVGTFTTTGNPKPGVWTLKCTAAAVNAGTFEVRDPDGILIDTFDTMGAHVIGGLGFTIADGSSDWEVGDEILIDVPATNVVVTSAWKGASANGLKIEIVSDVLAGLTFTVVQPTGGAVNPDVTQALAQVGNTWETMVLNALEIGDTSTLDKFRAWGEPRWGGLVRRPAVVFTGNTIAAVDSATAVAAARGTDMVNAQLVAPGSPNLPFVVAAAMLARIAASFNADPASDPIGLQVPALTPGADSVQWSYSEREAAVLAGSSTSEVVDGVIRLGDTVLFYHPTGEDPPAYRFVADVVKLANILYNFELEFTKPEWQGAPLLSDGQSSDHPRAKTPSDAKASAANVLYRLGQAAIIDKVTESQKAIRSVKSATNSKRIDLVVPVVLAGTTNVIDLVIPWGFSYG